MRLLFVDHEDSFSMNVVQEFLKAGVPVDVVSFHNLPVHVEGYSGVVLSPGPGHPTDYPETRRFLESVRGKIPVVGVCLGHQLLGLHLGGEVRSSRRILHGKTTPIFHTGDPPFKGIPRGFRAMRYNSLVVDLAPEFVTARDELGEVMALLSPEYGWMGLQFHPESILTEFREKLFQGMLAWIRSWTLRSGRPVAPPSGR